jgi:hypothetical protein
MPITVFDIKAVSGHRRERIEAAVIASGKSARGSHEAWIAADSFNGGFRVLITGPHGFERTVVFVIDDLALIAERVRETLEDWSVRERAYFFAAAFLAAQRFLRAAMILALPAALSFRFGFFASKAESE